MSTKFLKASIFFALTLSATLSAQAQTLYQVEVIVFSNNSSAAEREETWPQQLTLAYPNNTITLSPDTSVPTATTAGLETTTYKQLPLNQKMLSEWRDRLRASGKYRVLAHSSWLQPSIGQDANKSVVITGGNQFGDHYELEGSIHVKGTSPIKVSTNLWLSSFNLNGESDSSTPVLPALPQELLNQTTSNATSSSLYTVQRVIPHQNEENLLLGKAAYLDNPLIGVLVKVTTYKPTSADAAVNPIMDAPLNSNTSTAIPTSKTSIGAP
jgi:hypothetical protein